MAGKIKEMYKHIHKKAAQNTCTFSAALLPLFFAFTFNFGQAIITLYVYFNYCGVEMDRPKLNWVHLPLEGGYNFRDLGGLPAANGAQTKWHAFLRADNTANLTAADVQFLAQYGLKTVIDLRSQDELLRQPSVFAASNAVAYHHLPLIRGDVKNLPIDNVNFLADLYLDLLGSSKHVIKSIFEVIAAAQQGCIAYNCTAGKDRTGIISMLLLGLAGCRRGEIVANYASSFTYLSDSPEFKNIDKGFPMHVMSSKPEFMQQAYDSVIGEHGTIEKYLLSCGLANGTLQAVKALLV